MKKRVFICFILGLFFTPSLANHAHQDECVVLLHGLARSKSSMKKAASAIAREGYRVVNQGYPSTKHKIEYLSNNTIPKALKRCGKIKKTHFVTHSMGGILLRHYLQNHAIGNLGRVVMLSPPNQGSEVVDKLKNTPGFKWVNGPAGRQLGTDAQSLPNQLGPADFPLGIITGSKSINLILSQIIPGEDDGKVSIERAKLEGMEDFLIVPHSHTFIMKNKKVINQILQFIHFGKFDKSNI